MSGTASAPGKVVLSGEYAVLDGAPAVCMAIDRRAVASVTSGNTTDTPASTLVDAVMRESGARAAPVCDTAAFATSKGEKLGLGSSAALTVAMLAAIEDRIPTPGRAIRVHREWQGGSGSGVDVACSIQGGLIEYSMSECKVSSLPWPELLKFQLVWSGSSSNTGDKLAQLKRAQPKASSERLALQSTAMAGAWRSGDAGTIMLAYRDYVEALRAFSVDHALGIFDAGHDELTDAAIREDIVYKPCGAGGGDVGVALSTDTAALDDFVRHHRLSTVDCALDRNGVLIHSE